MTGHLSILCKLAQILIRGEREKKEEEKTMFLDSSPPLHLHVPPLSNHLIDHAASNIIKEAIF